MQNACVGLEDRSYMHEDDARPLSPREWLAGASLVGKLIVLNALVFVLWQFPSLQPFLYDHFTVGWEGLRAGRVWTLFTCALSHSDLLHLVFNMVALQFVGRDLEAIYGARNVAALYLFGAALSGLGHAALMLAWHTPHIPALGASGSVMALMVVAALFFPHRRAGILFLPVAIPLSVLATAFVLLDLLGAMGKPVLIMGHAVAHGGHLGGAVAGALWKLLDLRPFRAPQAMELGPSLLERLRGVARAGARPRLRVLPPLPSEPPAASPPTDPQRVDAATAERVDDLLRKINRDGIQALSAEEREFLEQASLRYRK